MICVCTTHLRAQVDTKVYVNGQEASNPLDTLASPLSADVPLPDSLTSQKLWDENQFTDSLDVLSRLGKPRQDSSFSQFQKAETKATHLEDSVNTLTSKGQALADKLTPETIYSERMLEAMLDSLGLDKFPSVPLKELSDEDLLAMINEKTGGLPSVSQDSMASTLDGATSLADVGLEQEALGELTPLSGQVVDSKYYQYVDSLRQMNLEEQGLQVKEQGVDEVTKITSLDETETFWNKTYLEGLLGFLGDPENFVLQLAPALGYHLSDYTSLGLGPVVQISKNDAGTTIANLGFRPFYKQEFFKRRAYLQAEYIWTPTREELEDRVITGDQFLGGGGVLIPVSGILNINLSVMYQFNHQSETTVSPWVVRVGISTLKNTKSNKS